MVAGLPIDALLPEIQASLETNPRLVIEAAPGAGKTTRVPQALHERSPNPKQQVIVCEPRRLAARLAATYVAEERGTAVGELVGYSVRFEDRSGPRTRIRYVTEGVLLQELLRAPTLPHAHTVVLDEFHERHLATDQLLALLDALQSTRPELRLIVMSATLDAQGIAEFLRCPRVRSEGRRFDVEVLHETRPDDRPLEKRVASAVRDALAKEQDGHVLVFLPGAREIQRARELLTAERPAGSSAGQAFEVHVLHGEQPIAEQAEAVRASTRRKVVLATNVAESSVTVPDVTAVVDSGLARVAGFSAWSGRSTLSVQEVSQASAIQRAGRAGRTRPGSVFRLYSEANFKRRPERDLPEIQRLDLSELVLQVAGVGKRLEALRWLDAPPARALASARELLQRLGAFDVGGHKLSAVGKRLLDFPLPPRLACVVMTAEELGVGEDGALAAALLSERDIRIPPRGQVWDLPTSLSDVQDRIDAYREAEYDEFRPAALRAAGLDVQRVSSVRRAFSQLTRKLSSNTAPPSNAEQAERLLRRSLLRAFSDRVALHQPNSKRLILENGTTASVSPLSVVRHAPFVVALEVEEHGQGQGPSSTPRVQWLSAIEPDWLLEDYSSQIETREELAFNSDKLRVELISRMTYGSVTLDESRTPAPPSPQASELLFAALQQRSVGFPTQGAALDGLACRIKLLHDAGLGTSLPPAAELSSVELLRRACATRTSFAELEEIALDELLLDKLSDAARSVLRKEAPEAISLPGGRRVTVHYEPGKPPWIASRLQDFFGLSTGPRIAAGRVPLTLHLLAPNQRAVQVTSDLGGFWERHYPEIRRQLCRKYPRHAWPEDGKSATPPAPKPPRR
jgi:ATP-dependent helicase HrpB